MNIRQILLKTGAILSLCALSTASSATIITTTDSALFSFKDTYLMEYGKGNAVSESDYREIINEVQTISLDRFDETLGTLLDVDIWFETTWSLASTVYSKDSRHRKMASAAGRSVSNLRVRMTDPMGDPERTREVVSASCQDDSSCVTHERDSGSFDGSLDLSDFTLDDFIGTDDLNFRISRTLVANLTRCGQNDYCYLRNTNNAWSGNIAVSYTYTDSPAEDMEVSVPEPTSLALLGLGLIGIGAARLGRKRNI